MPKWLPVCCPTHPNQRSVILQGGATWCVKCGTRMVPETEVYKREGTD